MKRQIFLIGIVLIAVLITLISTGFSYKNAINAADDFLKAQSLGIAATLETALSRFGKDENIFSGIIEEDKWEGIAFVGLYGEDGTIILHSNKNLINRKVDDSDIKKTFESHGHTYGYATLATGEEIFILNYPVHLQNKTYVLRVALHTYPARMIVRQARVHMFSVLVVLSVLFVIAGSLQIISRKKERLEKALIEKEKLSIIGEMASVLAHEIRNPLGSIKGFAQYLKEQSAGSKPQDKELTETYLDIIVSESRRIERLTEDLLVYARQDDIAVETFNLTGLINDVMSSLSVHERITIRPEVQGNITISSDKNKLRQILTNLIQNASDATAGTGEIGITAKEHGNGIMLTVSDSGEGIPDNDIGKIFKPFFTTKTKGTGLGLAIVERYVKALGGEITVESASGKGSLFRISIPKRG